MRNRTTILFLLACCFAVIFAVGANRQVTACADRNGVDSNEFLSFDVGQDDSCAVDSPSTPMKQLLLVLTFGCAGAAMISAGKVWKDMQQDRALLQGAVFALTRHHYR